MNIKLEGESAEIRSANSDCCAIQKRDNCRPNRTAKSTFDNFLKDVFVTGDLDEKVRYGLVKRD